MKKTQPKSQIKFMHHNSSLSKLVFNTGEYIVLQVEEMIGEQGYLLVEYISKEVATEGI